MGGNDWGWMTGGGGIPGMAGIMFSRLAVVLMGKTQVRSKTVGSLFLWDIEGVS